MQLLGNTRTTTPALLMAAALLLLPSCTRVIRQESPYYIRGPHQPDPPNGYFAAGKKVLVFGKKDSYKRVLTFDGTAAYVWERDLVTLSEWKEEQRRAGDAE